MEWIEGDEGEGTRGRLGKQESRTSSCRCPLSTMPLTLMLLLALAHHTRK